MYPKENDTLTLKGTGRKVMQVFFKSITSSVFTNNAILGGHVGVCVRRTRAGGQIQHMSEQHMPKGVKTFFKYCTISL